ncbi:MAG: gamma-glutamyltransferase, partial [Myxococcota bacterium]|nr:gamma-glutamyltransferase [Myxococcota bacterium]
MGSRASQKGAVAAGDHRTAEAGLHALREGGNAVDAAVAALLCATVVEPLLTSLGGGGVALVRDGRDGAVRAHDFFGVHPGRNRRAGPVPPMKPVPVDYGVEQQIFHIGSGSVAVPGLPAGIDHLHRRYGTLPLTVLAEPAVHHARAGVAVGINLRTALTVIGNLLRDDPEVARRYFPDGTSLEIGAILRQPDLGDTVERFAREGADLFYRGDLAQAMVAFAGGSAGQLTLDDLAGYRCHERPPILGSFRNARFATVPPPAAGGALLAYALGILHRIGPLGTEVTGPALVQLARVMSAADAVRDGRFHLELDDRTFLADLLGDDNLDRGAEQAAVGAPFSAPGGNPVGSTTHLSTVDGDGWMVTATSSNGETCGYLLPGAGVLLNNFLGEEDLQGPSGEIPAPGSRIRTMMTPTL